MATKEVTISNIKSNLSTEPLVNDPEVLPRLSFSPSKSDNLYYSFTTAGIYFTVYFD